MKKFYLLTAIVLCLSNITTGQSKKVLFEEFTNASCGPCAANNPALKAFLESKGDTIVAIMYHTNFPGFDPLNVANPNQVEERRTGYYTDVNAVPWLKGDGDMYPDIWPFTLANFNNAFDTRKNVTPLLNIDVTDHRITVDSVKATVRISIPANLPAGNYKLRVMATERVIEYANPPGTNGERIFEHVFRKGFPDMNGTALSTTAGNYEYIYKYKVESEWQDTSIYTIAFVQNDLAGKEVLNCASANSVSTSVFTTISETPESFVLYQNYPNPFNPVTTIKFSLSDKSVVSLRVFDLLGREVATLMNEFMAPGTYEVKFNAESISSGVYHYRLESKEGRITKSFVVLK